MFAYYLLFDTEEQYICFCDMPEDPDLFDHLNMDIIEERLCCISQDFPVQFIRKMNSDVSVAEFRNEVFRDLFRDSAWKSAEELCNQISSLRTQSDIIKGMKDSVQKKIGSVHIAARYFDLLDRLCAFVMPFRSKGLHRAFEIFQTYLMRQETIDAKAAVFRVETFLESYLRVSLRIDRIKKTVTFADAESDGSDALQDLDRLCRELTGVPVLQPFSIVDASSPTLLEKLTLNHVLCDHEDLAFAIQNIPDVDMIWEQLMLFQTQVCFYIAFIKLTEQLKRKNLSFCYPKFDDYCRICARGAYDLSLSIRNMEEVDFNQTVNDIDLHSDMVGFILTGANQGGKTTYIRATGIVVYLSMCGCPVPAESVILYPYQTICTLFGGEEDQKNEVSRFELEVKKYYLRRKYFVPSTLVLLNEYFTGTNRLDAVEILGQCIMELIDRQVTYGCVTHFQEICEILGASANKRTQYLRAEHPSDIDIRKRYVIEQGYPDGRAYSEQITQKLGMTYDALIRQFQERDDNGV